MLAGQIDRGLPSGQNYQWKSGRRVSGQSRHMMGVVEKEKQKR